MKRASEKRAGEEFALDGWCVIALRKHNIYPSMTCNVSDREQAQVEADRITKDGGRILAICAEDDLEKFVPLIRLCRELDVEMDGVTCPKSAAAILNAIRRLVGGRT